MEAAIRRIEQEQAAYGHVLGSNKLNPQAFDAWLANLPERPDLIEDRRAIPAPNYDPLQQELFHRRMEQFGSKEERDAYAKLKARAAEQETEEEFHRRRGRSKVEHKGEWSKAEK
jgi:hypothetical protein